MLEHSAYTETSDAELGCILLLALTSATPGSIKTVSGDGTTRHTVILKKVIQKRNQRPRNKSIDPFETCHGALSIVNLPCTQLSASKKNLRSARIGPDAVSVSHEVLAFNVVFAHHYLGRALLGSVTTKTRDDK